MEPWFVEESFFLLRLLFISINLPYRFAWNTVMPGLVFLPTTTETYMKDCFSVTCCYSWTLCSSSKCSHLNDTLNAFNNFKNKQKTIWSNAFWYVKVCIFCKCIQHTIQWDKTQLKRIPSYNINGTKNALFFSRAPTHHSLTFNLRFLYELKHKVRFSKTVCNFPFSSPFRFYWSLYGLLTLKRHDSFQN